MTKCPPAQTASESRQLGFVLVGVLMFILVLTILGLTLFSLSSLESQFFYRSNDELTARYAAMSGIERAKFVLSATGLLGAAQNTTGVPIDGLIYTVAKQGPDFDTADSTGPVRWVSDSTVWIRSLAVVNGERALVEARFSPHPRNDLYRQLFTLSDPSRGLQTDPGGIINMVGALVQQSNDTGAFMQPGVTGPNPVTTGVDIDAPDISDTTKAYLGKYWSTAKAIAPTCNDSYDLDARSSPDSVGFFKTALVDTMNDPVNVPPSWSLNADYGGNHLHDCLPHIATITVHGSCIWMFDHGARFYKRLQVSGYGEASDALILVAGVNKTSGLDAGLGIAFKAGLSTNVPIVLISSGGVGIDHSEALTTSTSLSYLSVFAARSKLSPPNTPSSLSLNHTVNAPQDLPGGVIDRLVESGYLPNTTVSNSGSFTPIAGTWHEIKSTDGSY